LNHINPEDTTVLELKGLLASEKDLDVPDMRLSLQFNGPQLQDEAVLADLGLRNGQILFLAFDKELVPTGTARKVTADGRLVAVSHDDATSRSAFKPGMLAMRDMKRHWNWMEFEALQKAFEFVVKRPGPAHCRRTTLDTDLGADFHNFVAEMAYQQRRFAFLYGIFREDNEVEAITLYEPPQLGSDTGLTLLEDPDAEHVEAVAKMLGLERVGIVFSHPPRDKEIVFTSQELILAAEHQVKAAKEGLGPVAEEEKEADAPGEEAPKRTLFVAVKLKKEEEGGVYEAFQVTDKGMAMVDAGALLPNPEPDKAALVVSPKFDVVVEAKKAETVDTSFFLAPVAITHLRFQLSHRFPKPSRLGRRLTSSDLKQHIVKCAGASPSSAALAEALFDFQLLVYLQSEPALRSIVPAICDYILEPSGEGIPEGYAIILKSFAGLEA